MTYDPNTQRFLSLDPIGFEAGDFNFYRYVGNDPVNYVDPFGLLSAAQMQHALDAKKGWDKIKDKKDQIEGGIDRTKKIKECYKKAARVCPGKDVDIPDVCYIDRMKAEEKCKIVDIMDLGKSTVIGMTGAIGIGIDAVGGFNTPSKEGNTSKTMPKGKEKAGEISWIVATDKNGTIKQAVFHCN